MTGHAVHLGLVPYDDALGIAALARRRRRHGRVAGHGPLPRAPARDHARAARPSRASCTCPPDAEVEIVETDRGGKSTFHGPGQLVCYPILDLKRHGQDVQRYCRDLEEALIRTLAAFGLDAKRIEGLTGIWLSPPPRKIASIGVHISSWITTHGYALNVDLDPAPFTEWITACGLEDAAFTTMARELGASASRGRRPRRSRDRDRRGVRARSRLRCRRIGS